MANNDKKQIKKKRPWWKRGLRILGWIFLSLFILFLLLVLFIRSPWGQDIIVSKVTEFVSGKTDSEVAIKKLYITFSGGVYLEGLYLEDNKGDTLIYSDKLQADIPFWPIIRGNPISIDGVKWSGLRANVIRKDTVEGFNFQFLIDAFASDSMAVEEIDTVKSKPPKISVGSLDFSNFKLNYNDAVSGMNADLDLGELHFKGKNIDLEKMKFEVAKLTISDTKIDYEQTKSSPPSEDTETTLPFLSLDNLKLNNITAHYKSVPDSMDANLELENLNLQVPKVDLVNQDIEVGNLLLENSYVSFHMAAPKKGNTVEPEGSIKLEKSESFSWPDWDIKAKSIVLANNHLHFQQGEKPINLQGFNPQYIDVPDFNFNATDIALSKNESAKFRLNNMSFNESSGLSLSQLALYVMLDSTSFSVNKLELKTGNSSLHADLNAQFTSLASFIDNPDNAQLTLNLNPFTIDLNDAFVFLPDLKENEYLEKLSKHNFIGEVKANGILSDIDLAVLGVNWGQNTTLHTHGKLKNLTDFDHFIADIENLTFNSTKSDIATIVSEEELGIAIPETILVESEFHGGLNDLKAQVQLRIPEGKIKVDGQFVNGQNIAFDAKINVLDFNLGKVLKNPDIGIVSFEMDASGKGNTVNDLNAKLASQFSKLEYNGYDFSALELNGKIDHGKGGVTVCYRDKNLDLNVDSKIELDSISPQIDLDFKLEGADLYTLGLTEKQIRAKLMMKASFKGNMDQFTFESHFSEGVAVYDESTYSLGPVDLTADISKDSTAMVVKSDFLNGELHSNANPANTSQAIKHQLKRYFLDSLTVMDSLTAMDSPTSVDSLKNPVLLKMNMKLSETKLLTAFLVPEIETMDTLNLSVDFEQDKNKLVASLSLPYLDYQEKTLDSLQFDLNSSAEEAKFKFGFNKLDGGPFVMNRTYFEGDLQNGLLSLDFHSFDGAKEIYLVRTEVSGNTSDLKVHFDDKELLFNGDSWAIPADNLLHIQKEDIIAQSLEFSRENQRIIIANDLVETTQKNIGIGFTNFKLANLLALFNTDDLLASGDFNGEIVVINPFENLGLKADFSINNLTALKASLGELTLKAASGDQDNYTLDLGIQSDDIDLTIKGDYSLKNISSALDFEVDLNKIGMKTIAALSGENLKDASGNISGKLAIQGNVSSPEYAGYVQFNEALFNVTQLNSQFRLANDKIKIDNTQITLNAFSIEDGKKNTFTLNGSILTKDFSDPEFDLSIKAKNFQALNSTIEDNKVFYGDVNFDMDGTLKGQLSAPKANMHIGVNKSTDFTYILQDSQAKLEKREGIVEFVNVEDPDNILTRKQDSTVIATFGGIELHAKLNIEKDASFNVIIDPKTGDNLNISGGGDLDFNIEKNGRTTLSGRYEIDKGHYSLSLYNLVKRRFEIERGSSVTWHGNDPMDAELHVTAKYALETSASALMAAQIAGSSEEVRNKYRQKLPFWVFLNVKGELDQPKLNFLLGMPEDSRGAIDGTVYSRIEQVNSEEDELNKQVFSLLVLKKFYPNAGSDGSNGGVASIARDNINDALADQLNVFSDKLMGNTGVELNFGLNSYTDYQGESAEQRTDLNVTAQKKLLDDRLIIQVGSTVNVQGNSQAGEENAVVGNASIQYLITEDGRWRLKGFRNSEYENVLDGQVFVNGISVIYQRQFNKLNELFKKPIKEEKKSEEEPKEEKAIENTEKKAKTDKKAND